MIRLGYEIGTGRSIDIPLDHTAVTGRTQQSGKTTTLEALVHRSGKRAVVFVTKKAESGFRDAKPIPPYFRDSGDWQFVATIMEALMGERMKFERSWIINACKGAGTLAEVHENIKEELHGKRNPNYGHKEKGKKRDDREWLKKPASGMNEGVLTSLDAYLDIVIPQIEKLPYTAKLELGPGLNVMDLSEYTTELQGLVIRSVLKWIYEKEQHTITIIPEAWEFIPQQRKSPVLVACEELIRKGAAAGNFVWLDAQDIAAMHKNVLRSVGVWILGVQREQNEIKRLLAHIPDPKPTATEVMKLARGQFFACFKTECRKLYVQPFWITGAHAEAVARGEEDIASVEKIWQEKLKERKAHVLTGAREKENTSEDESMYKELYEKAQTDIVSLKEQIESLIARNADLTVAAYGSSESAAESLIPAMARNVTGGIAPVHTTNGNAPPWGDVRGTSPMPPLGKLQELPALEVRAVSLNRENIGEIIELLKAQPEVIELLRTQPKIKVSVRRPQVSLDDSTLIGKIGILAAEHFFAAPREHRAVYDELKKRWGVPGQVAHVYPPLKKLNQDGVLEQDGSGFRLAPGLKIETVEV
jgi:hypothetical protein